MKSPLRYPGGKSRLAKKILEFIPEDVPVASPFFGGGSVELALMSRGQRVSGNDAFAPLSNFWDQAFFCNEDLIELCKKALTCTVNEKRRLFQSSRVDLQDLGRCRNIDSAFSYFLVNRCSFSGATLSGGFSELAAEYRFNKSSVERLAKLNEDYFLGCSNSDFRCDINNHPEYFLYCDPPYYEIDGLYGNNGDMSFGYEDHQDLSEILKNHPNGWALSYNDCPQIRKLYDGFKFVELKPSLSMSNGKKSCPEILIIKEG